MTLNAADAVYFGSTPADAVYLGAVKVWPPAPTGPAPIKRWDFTTDNEGWMTGTGEAAQHDAPGGFIYAPTVSQTVQLHASEPLYPRSGYYTARFGVSVVGDPPSGLGNLKARVIGVLVETGKLTPPTEEFVLVRDGALRWLAMPGTPAASQFGVQLDYSGVGSGTKVGTLRLHWAELYLDEPV